MYPAIFCIKPEANGVQVRVHFDARPTSFVFAPFPLWSRYKEDGAICAAVIEIAIQQQICAAGTSVFHFRRRYGQARVMVISRQNGQDRVIRTAFSSNPNPQLAAAEACARAIVLLPQPAAGDLIFRVRM